MRWIAALSVLAGLLACGCGDPDEAPDHCGLQPFPSLVSKAFFAGDSTIDPIDAPGFLAEALLLAVEDGASVGGALMPGTRGPVTRVRFEIHEDFLIAMVVDPASPDQGATAAVFAILVHIDDPCRGRQGRGDSVENSTQRPWYEQKYMRVDWSLNLLSDAYRFDQPSLAGIAEAASYASLSYYVNDPTHPHAPRLDFATGHLGLTLKAFVFWNPVSVNGSEVPGCLAAASPDAPATTCDDTVITIRQTFWRTDAGHRPAGGRTFPRPAGSR